MSVSNFFKDTLFFTPAALILAGTSTTPLQVAVQDIAACKDFVVQINATSVGTNVVVRVEGSLDGTNYFNMGSGDTTISSSGVSKLIFTGMPVKYLRGALVSITGGTPSVAFTISGL